MKCAEHREKDAIGACVSCGRGICEDCTINLAGKNYCQDCADELVQEKSRHAEQKSASQIEIKSPTLAIVLSIIIPGLGHFYLGKIKKGVILLVAAIISPFLIIAFLMPLIAVLYLIVWLYAVINSYTTAKKINRGEATVNKNPINPEIIEEEENIIVKTNLSYAKKENININITEDWVEIIAKFGNEKYKLKTYRKSIKLPVQINVKKATAKFKDFILTVKLPKL